MRIQDWTLENFCGTLKTTRKKMRLAFNSLDDNNDGVCLYLIHN